MKVLNRFSADKDYELRILRAVESVNAFQKARLVTRMKGHFGSLNLKTIVAGAWRWHAAPPHRFRVAIG